jgi:glycosyltransferase involved in cell wall biosynthesis
MMSSVELGAMRSRHEESWRPDYGHLPTLICERNLAVGVEVGVAFGGHSEAILGQPCVRKLYGVDSYQHRPGYKDPMNLLQPDFDRLCEQARQRLAKFGDRFQLVRENSQAAAAIVPDGLDFVYLDADHSYQAVFDDLCTWFPKVRIGGIVSGHDYGHLDFPGVRQAVDEFFRRLGLVVAVRGGAVWWVEKRDLHLSCIMPAYNCAATVRESVESLLQGNLGSGDEIVIVDDASTDNTAGVLAELAAAHSCIRVITHPKNRGGGAARNTAVENAKHSVIFCLDSDNLLKPNSLPPLRDFFVHTGADVVAFGELHYFRTDPSVLNHKWVLKPGRFTLQDHLSTVRSPGASGNYLYSKESWVRAGGYPEFAGALDTWGFGFRQLASGARMFVQPGSCYLHRWTPDSYWTREEAQNSPSIRAFQVMVPYLDLIVERDVRYMLSEKHRRDWLLDLDRRPIRLKGAELSLFSRRVREYYRLAKRKARNIIKGIRPNQREEKDRQK